MAKEPLKDLTWQGIPMERWEAGQDYLRALRGLEFEPDAMLWVRHLATEEFMLAIVTPTVDRVGPAEIYDALFLAYERAGTPASIDPWIVTVFSPSSFFRKDVEAYLQMNIRATGQGGAEVSHEVLLALGNDYEFRASWVYVASKASARAESKVEVRKWARFKENLEKLAA